MFPAAHKNRHVALAAGIIGGLAVLADVAVSRSPVPLAYFALAMCVAGIHVPSLSTRMRRMLVLAGIVASVASLVLVAAKFV